MIGVRLSVNPIGFSKASKKLEKAIGLAKRPSVPSMQASVWLTEQTIKAFDEEGKPEKWVPLSMMALFIRAHRAGVKNPDGVIGADSGRLKGSFVPMVSNEGDVIGVSTNVEYASDFNYGGTSEPAEISISSFVRRRSIGNQNKDSMRGGVFKTAERVRAYVLHLKGGAPIPPRPFFPDGLGELQSWGYLEKIRDIFADYFNTQLGGTI